MHTKIVRRIRLSLAIIALMSFPLVILEIFDIYTMPAWLGVPYIIIAMIGAVWGI